MQALNPIIPMNETKPTPAQIEQQAAFELMNRLSDWADDPTTPAAEIEKVAESFLDRSRDLFNRVGKQIGTTHDLLKSKIIILESEDDFASFIMLRQELRKQRDLLAAGKIHADDPTRILDAASDLFNMSASPAADKDHSAIQLAALEAAAHAILFLQNYKETKA